MMTQDQNAPPEAIVSLRGITNRFGEHAIHQGLDLDIRKGEILGLIGGSGAGKSVLLRTILGLNKQAEGDVVVGEEARHLVGVVVGDVGPEPGVEVLGVADELVGQVGGQVECGGDFGAGAGEAGD